MPFMFSSSTSGRCNLAVLWDLSENRAGARFWKKQRDEKKVGHGILFEARHFIGRHGYLKRQLRQILFSKFTTGHCQLFLPYENRNIAA